MSTADIWVYDEVVGMNLRKINYVPGLYKIFDEILVNAADHKQRDPEMNVIKVEIDADKNQISVYNNGEGNKKILISVFTAMAKKLTKKKNFFRTFFFQEFLSKCT